MVFDKTVQTGLRTRTPQNLQRFKVKRSPPHRLDHRSHFGTACFGRSTQIHRVLAVACGPEHCRRRVPPEPPLQPAHDRVSEAGQ